MIKTNLEAKRKRIEESVNTALGKCQYRADNGFSSLNELYYIPADIASEVGKILVSHGIFSRSGNIHQGSLDGYVLSWN
jgi:hypothetical protein